MALFVKYLCEFTDDLGADWKIEILKESATQEAVTYLKATGNPLILSWYGSDDPTEQVICGSKLDLNVWAAQDFELLALFTSNNLEYPVQVYVDSVLTWTGFIAAENYTEPYNAAPFQTTITANDGLGLLKSFMFSDLGYTTRTRFDALIKAILAKVNILTWDEYINIYKTGMAATVTDSPLDQAGPDPDLFQGKTCYQALEIILETFQAVIKQDGAKYVIYCPLDIAGTMYGRRFTSTTKTAISQAPDQYLRRPGQASPFAEVEGGALTMIPQASQHITNYDFKLKDSALEKWDFHYNDFSYDGSYHIAPWGPISCIITPLGAKLAGEENGVHLESTTDSLLIPGMITQSIANIKAAPGDPLKLTIDYMVNNMTGGAITSDGQAIQIIIQTASYTRYYSTTAGGWTESNVKIILSSGEDPPGWSEWKSAVININGIPSYLDGGTMFVRLLCTPVTGTLKSQYTVAFKDVALIMAPLSGPAETGIGYTYQAAPRGRIIELERILGDGFTVVRHAANQLLSYAGILHVYDGGAVADPLTTGGLTWRTRGNTEDLPILELLNDRAGVQYTRARQLIDLPVWVNDKTAFIRQLGNIQDLLNQSGGVNRIFHIAIRKFNARQREYQLILTEIIS